MHPRELFLLFFRKFWLFSTEFPLCPCDSHALLGVDSGRGQDDTLRLPPPSFAPRLSPVAAFVVAMSAVRPFGGCDSGKI